MAKLSVDRSIAAIVLAAGKGTRMRSEIPKVLHRLAGRPMLSWVCEALRVAGVGRACVILSDDLRGFEDFIEQRSDLNIAIQQNRQGTGDAVASAAWSFEGVKPASFAVGRALRGSPISSRHVLISAGDTPALSPDLIRRFIDESLQSGAALSVLGMRVPEPKGYGRMLMQGSDLLGIIEERDATPEQRLIDACNTGVIFAETATLFSLVADLKPDNSQKEFYLTDCVKIARARGLRTHAVVVDDWHSFAGVNDRRQLAELETWLVRKELDRLMESGVSVRLPETVYVDAGVIVGRESELAAGVSLKGRISIGNRCKIGHGVALSDCELGEGVEIGAGSVLQGCKVAAGERVPPLSLRIETTAPGAH